MELAPLLRSELSDEQAELMSIKDMTELKNDFIWLAEKRRQDGDMTGCLFNKLRADNWKIAIQVCMRLKPLEVDAQ